MVEKIEFSNSNIGVGSCLVYGGTSDGWSIYVSLILYYSRWKYYCYHQNAKYSLLPFQNGNFFNIAITLEREPSKKKQITDNKKDAKRI